MKSLLTISVLTLLNIKLNFLPTGTLMAAMAASIVLDFVTGLIKAVIAKDARTSQGYRKTVVKFMQYGGAVCVSMLMKFLMMRSGETAMQAISPYADYLNNGLLIFILFIEITSILENMYAIDNSSPFAQYFIKPLLSIMTVAIKNNSIAKKAAEQMEAKDQTPTS
ncbi:MAG: phage holin family protein [Bacteroidetes bacterium]|nr:phage holin family protein [Bacteroidota bacterium]